MPLSVSLASRYVTYYASLSNKPTPNYELPTILWEALLECDANSDVFPIRPVNLLSKFNITLNEIIAHLSNFSIDF